jgi:hypothetical protein
VAERLRRLGVSQDAIAVERAAMEVIQVGPSNNRSVLASMNDFVFHLRFQLKRHYTISDADAIEDILSEAPMGAIEMKSPDVCAGKLFNLDPKEIMARRVITSILAANDLLR